MKTKVKRMVGVALMMALVVVFQMLGGVIPSFGGFNFSLVLIPIVVGSAIYGVGAGAILGATFGTIVFINCYTGVDVGGAMVFQANPYLCFVVVMGKGVLAGVASGLVYKLLRKRNTYFAMLCAAIICPVINTGIFVACMMTFFMDILSVWAGGGEVIAYVLTGLVLANFVPELILNIAFSPVSNRLCIAARKKQF